MERLGGYMTSLVRDLRRGSDLEIGPLLPIDQRLAAFSPSAHLADDFFENRIAFVVLLNFPLTTLEDRLENGGEWTRRQWAETRLAHGFASRVPAEVGQAAGEAFAAADSYINAYNIYLHHLLTEDGRRLFPEGLRLISHWGLRDELKARYADPDSATSQFFINLRDNDFLNHGGRDFGYAVFGKVADGMDVVDAIAAVPTGNSGFHQDVPLETVTILEVTAD